MDCLHTLRSSSIIGLFVAVRLRAARWSFGRKRDWRSEVTSEGGRCGFSSTTHRPGGPHGASPVPIALPLAVAGYFHVRLRR
jgi:hypothetical protein